MVPVLFIAAFAAAGYAVSRWYTKPDASPTATYTQHEQDTIRAKLVGQKKSPYA